MCKQQLTPQLRLFADEWLIDFNGVRAAKAAGYTDSVANISNRMLAYPAVVEYVTKAQEITSKKLEVTREAVIQEMARIGLADVRELFTRNGMLKPITSLDDDTAAAVASVEVVSRNIGYGEDVEIEHTHKIKLHNKVQALDKLGQHFNIYEDHQSSGASKVAVIIEGPDAKA